MRIKCAKCGKTHDSDVAPFKYNIVPDICPDDHGDKVIESDFKCKHCGVLNNVEIKWYASWTWEDRIKEWKKMREENVK